MIGRPAARGHIARTILLAVSLLVGLALIAGFFGEAVPFFDTLAHFRAHLGVLLLMSGVLLMTRRRVLTGLAATLLGGFGLVSALPHVLPAPAPQAAHQGAAYTLLQMNLRWNVEDRAAAIRLIGRLQPDVVALEEAGEAWRPLLDPLADRYPYRYDCGEPDTFGKLTLLSRRSFAADDAGTCDADDGFLSRAVNFNGSRVTIAVQHLRWPWPGRQWQQLARLEDRLAALAAPTLIAGDFNAAPWSAFLERYALLSGTRIVPHVGPTWLPLPLTAWLAPYAGLPIDNILASTDIEIIDVERPAATGSDHLPVIVTFAVPPAPRIEPAAATAGGYPVPVR
jgi:endonuclease/exonuclease/phosphatase (EEP) superfamily protein YafD